MGAAERGFQQVRQSFLAFGFIVLQAHRQELSLALSVSYLPTFSSELREVAVTAMPLTAVMTSSYRMLEIMFWCLRRVDTSVHTGTSSAMLSKLTEYF